MKDELLRLAERCEQADGADREIDADVCRAIGYEVKHHLGGSTPYYEPRKNYSWQVVPAYTASIDGALSLVSEDAFWRVGHDGEGPDPSLFRADVMHTPGSGHHIARAATPALAICAAALKARASMEKTDG